MWSPAGHALSSMVWDVSAQRVSPIFLVTTGVVPLNHLGTYIAIVIVMGMAATALAQAVFNRQITR